MGKHKERGGTLNEFCATAGTPCKCPQAQNYRTACKPKWVSHTFARIVNRKPKKIVIQIGYEAHHVLCISSVSTNIVANKNVKPVVEATKWCINHKKNMLALPLWGHYVRWYCKITAEEAVMKTRVPVPPFSNLPAHDYDHNCNGGYTKEVDAVCKKIADGVKSAKKKHEIEEADLKGQMDSASTDWKAKLRARGKRNGGTHASWKKGKTDTTNAWCQAFSMANNAFVKGKSFPAREFDAETQKWMDRIQKAVKAS